MNQGVMMNLTESDFIADDEAQAAVQLSNEQDRSRQLPMLPREILKQIVTYAMTPSEEPAFNMPCLTSALFKPGLNLSCLLLDRDLYHTARQALYQNNTFHFKNFGSDIQKISSAVGLLGCRNNGCVTGTQPVLSQVTFTIGCKYNPERSLMRTQAFSCALKALRPALMTSTLVIELENYAWRNDAHVQVFANALAKVNVKETFVLKGLDVHLERSLRLLPKALEMCMQPVYMDAAFRRTGWQELGFFECTYRKEHTPSCWGSCNAKALHKPGSFDDPIARYHNWLQTAEQASIVNGLDYVTEVGYDLY